MTTLILQVLGNSDIQVFGTQGCVRLQQVDSLESIQQEVKWLEDELIEQDNLDKVKLPLVEKLRSQTSDVDTIFAFILTNQVKWMEEQDSDEGWRKYVALDGIWWKNILKYWCQKQNIMHYPIILDIGPEFIDGAAHWEGMAKLLYSELRKYFLIENNLISFQPEKSDKISIDKIIVQHSSGTPALSSALYLWGIEKKLAFREKIEFVYIPEDKLEVHRHFGENWQWRLKDPQIRELLKIQDFSGAFQLLDDKHQNYNQLKEQLEFLDKSVSLNLDGRLQGRESVIERLSIAVWSEKAFRDRRQWLHWYLRVAGALELALLLLVEKQGNDDYKWEQQKLIFKEDGKLFDLDITINNMVQELLTKGSYSLKRKEELVIKFIVNKIDDNKWGDFKRFYCNSWLKTDPEKGFITFRNRLYHNLIGDTIDELLDLDIDNHPAQIAVDYLGYIIRLAGLETEVETRVNVYCHQVMEMIQLL